MSDLSVGLASQAREAAAPAISRLEFLPGWITYGPIVVTWIALGLWYRDLSLPTAANPRITTGGLCGERKSSILDLAEGEARAWIAAYVVIDTGAEDLARADAALAQAGLALPIVIKPDIGCNGTGVRLCRTRDSLADALAAFPRGVGLVLQAFVPLPGEAGIFYIRLPGEACGQVTSLTLKTPPMVIGDGRSSLRALIMADPRHARLAALYLGRLAGRLEEVPAQGEAVRARFCRQSLQGQHLRQWSVRHYARADRADRGDRPGHPGFPFRPLRCALRQRRRAAAGRGFPDHRNQRRRRGGHAYLGPDHIALGYLGGAAAPLRRRVEDRAAAAGGGCAQQRDFDDVSRLEEPAAADGVLSA